MRDDLLYVCHSLDDERDIFVYASNYINKNLTVCEENCEFSSYNYDTGKAVCSCEITIKLPLISEIKIDKNKLYDSFTDIKNIANINIMKCYKLFFSTAQ